MLVIQIAKYAAAAGYARKLANYEDEMAFEEQVREYLSDYDRYIYDEGMRLYHVLVEEFSQTQTCVLVH